MEPGWDEGDHRSAF